MKYDQSAIQAAQRGAFELLTATHTETITQSGEKGRIPNDFSVKPENVTSPANLVQEQPWVNTTNQFEFDFSINGQPAGAQAPNTNNVVLGKTNIAVCYGLQILFGEGTDPATRIYRSFGITPNDNSIYNSVVSFKYEQSTLVDKMNGLMFRDVYNSPLEFDALSGMILWQPLRVITGEIGTFKGVINILGNISAKILSANMFLSMRPLIVFGQASATAR